MVVLPKGFTATRYPGYFWDTKGQKLYSIKISGQLRELTKTYPNIFNHLRETGYRISHILFYLIVFKCCYLRSLVVEDSEIIISCV